MTICKLKTQLSSCIDFYWVLIIQPRSTWSVGQFSEDGILTFEHSRVPAFTISTVHLGHVIGNNTGSCGQTFFFYFFRRARKSADYCKSEKRSFSSRLQQKGKEHRLIGCYLCSLSTRSVAWRYKNNGVVEYQFHGWSVINSLRRAGSTSRCVLFFKYHDQFSSFSINRGRVDVREMVWYFGCEASKLFHQRSCIPQRLHF